MLSLFPICFRGNVLRIIITNDIPIGIYVHICVCVCPVRIVSSNAAMMIDQNTNSVSVLGLGLGKTTGSVHRPYYISYAAVLRVYNRDGELTLFYFSIIYNIIIPETCGSDVNGIKYRREKKRIYREIGGRREERRRRRRFV